MKILERLQAHTSPDVHAHSSEWTETEEWRAMRLILAKRKEWEHRSRV